MVFLHHALDGLPLDVLIITFMNSWLLLFTKRFISLPMPSLLREQKSSDEPLVWLTMKITLKTFRKRKKKKSAKEKKARTGWIVFFTVA
jgi:hypothetical protein